MSDILRFCEEIDLQKIVDEQARKLQRNVDEATLDKAADTLAHFGYVKADGKSRYSELFGTPERAARTLAGISCNGDCYSCSLYGAHCTCDGASQLEWLRGDAE